MEKDKELLIEAYFTKTLTTSQQKQLEWLLQNDTAFSEAFNFEKEIRDTLIYNKRQALKERFHALDKQEVKLARKLTTWWYAAASILVLIGAAWFFLSRQSEVTAEKLYAQYMEPYPNMVTPMVRGDIPADKVMSEALTLYDKRAYSESAVLLQQVYDEHPNDQTAFYLAICQLMLQNPNEAITLLEARDWKETSYFSPVVVNWYWGLAYLQLGDGEQALPRFKRVAESDDSLSAEARKVVKALENRSYF
jgi:tetratricopeptide (TPR) repeat protein